jgi:cell volume regulation protein A
MQQVLDPSNIMDRDLQFHVWLPQMTLWVGMVLLVAVMFNRYGTKLGLPSGLLFLGLGMICGEDGPLHIDFFDFDLTYGVGMICLILILFYAGLGIKMSHMRGAWTPSIALATVGVIMISALIAVFVKWWNPITTWTEAMLIGSVLGSTDAAAVFAALVGVGFKGRVRQIVELESGLNDPMAFILVFALTSIVMGKEMSSVEIGVDVLKQFAVGGAAGLLMGWLTMKSFTLLPSQETGLYPIRSVACALASYGVASIFGGSGLVSVFLCAIYLGNSALPLRATIVRVHDSLAWGGQITMFFFLGFLCTPHRLLEPQIMLGGSMVALWLAFVARPVAVAAIFLPLRIPWRETVCVAWLGLRGAVPIILSTIPLLFLGNPDVAPRAQRLFDLVLICVVVGCIIPGSIIKVIPRWLGMLTPKTLAQEEAESEA